MDNTKNNKILLIALHIEKAVGVRYLAKYLIQNGFDPTICSIHKYPVSPNLPEKISEEEILLLKELAQKEKYLFIGISILSSYTLSEVYRINDMLKNNVDIPIVWGGVCPSLMSKECAKHCNIVIKGEGEIPILRLAQALQNGNDWKEIPNLCYYDTNGNYIENELEPLIQDLDIIGYPLIDSENMFHIENNKIIQIDQQAQTNSYELSASRGCPFGCSYCSSSKIRDIYKGKGKYARIRSVNSVIEELKEAIKKNRNINEIHFWDEVFVTDKLWLSEFAQKYKKEIGLRFIIWAHPLTINHETISLLFDAGLRRVLIGFQSGSPNVRNNIFHRPESNEQIINASKILSSYEGLEVYYDLIICHVLESITELKETYDLCLKLEPPFGYQIRGLSYLPKTDITKTMVNMGIYTQEEMDNIFNAPFEEHFIQWNGPSVNYYSDEPRKAVWADLIYLTQFQSIRNQILKLAKNADRNHSKIRELKIKMENLSSKEQDKARMKPVKNFLFNFLNK